MLKKAIARFKTFLSFTAPDSYRDELTDYLNAINVARAKLTSFVFIICEIVLLTGSLIAKRDELFAPPRQHYIWMYLLMLLCMAGFFLLFKQIQEGIPGNRTKIRIAGILFTGFILFWCAGISLMDQLSGGQILVYIFAMIAVSVTPIFEPFISFIIYAPPQIFFTALSMLNSPGAAPQFGNMMNSTTFVGISWAISCMRYKTHVMEFNNSKLIEQKNAELKKMNAMLQEANRKLDRLSKTDGLTGISNRAVFDFMINMEWERCKRQFKPLSLIMIDIDFFKNYNDHYGHQAGDACIRQVAGVLSACAKRASDTVARYGGEEFAVILPFLGTEQANLLAEEIRNRVERLAIPHNFSATSQHVTISLGVHTVVPSNSATVQVFIRTTDKALYDAKKCRNKVVVVASSSA